MTKDEHDTIITAINRAQGVLTTLYALVRDTQICSMVDEDKNGALGNVVGDILKELNGVIEITYSDVVNDNEPAHQRPGFGG